ncbi:MAG: translation initiation factor IF-2 [Luteibaculaceae bacterium]
MTETAKAIRLSKAAKEFNVGISTLVDYLSDKGHSIDSNPNTKLESDLYNILLNEFAPDKKEKEISKKVVLPRKEEKETIAIETKQDELDRIKAQKEAEIKAFAPKPVGPKVVGKIDLDKGKNTSEAKPKSEDNSLTVEPKSEPKPEPVAQVAEPVKAPSESVEKESEQKAADEAPAAKIPETKAPEVSKTAEEPVKEKPPVVNTAEQNKSEEKVAEPEVSKPTVEPVAEVPASKTTEEPNNPDAPKTFQNDRSKEDDGVIRVNLKALSGPTVVGKIDLPSERAFKKPDPKADPNKDKKRKRKRVAKPKVDVTAETKVPGKGAPQQAGGGGAQNRPPQKPQFGKPKRVEKTELDEKEIQNQIKETLARLSGGGGKSKGAKLRRAKREQASIRREEEALRQEAEDLILKVTEFVTVSEVANMMNVGVNEIISALMSLGIFASINQRLDAETISIITEEFGYQVEFVTADDSELVVQEDEDEEEDLLPRSPIVTVMGHVDHGKTSLLDYIRKANVIAGEAGGITQHIGAYSVEVGDEKRITFLDTPGHEAFTAMRARGAQVTDLAIIVIAADDSVMPQTKEAISHAQAASVPMIFAINKIDKPGANPEKIKEELANMNILVEDWGGKYQCQHISAKQGIGIEDLLEKVLLEAEILELKANPDRNATGVVIESSLDKGRGYVTTILVEKGTLRVGDVLLAGTHYGRVKALFNERGANVKEVGPATPASMLGLTGAPAAGDKFNVFEEERDARNLALKRQQLMREQGLRAQKHITLDEIGRRLAIGDFKELNIIVKGDVDGSIEALSDSLLKLSTDEIQIRIIHKGVGAITESDVLLATASDAIIVGFQVRPSVNARKLAETEQIDIRLYSIIYKAIEEIRDAMEGMLSPDIVEQITGTADIRETFKITKVGTVAGCFVIDGKIKRANKVRVIRDGIVIYTGNLGSLKRFKDDVKEVTKGFECGLNIENFNDIRVGDQVEAFEEVEVKKTL